VEPTKKIKVYAGIPSTGNRVDGQNYWWRRAEKRYKDKIEVVYPEVFVGRIFHDYSRNEYVTMFLESDCDVLFFLDSDIVPPENLFDLITVHGDKWELAGAPYPVWMRQDGFDGPQVTYTVYKDFGDGKLTYSPVPQEGMDFVAGVATGCLFIKKHILEQMEKPYFEFKYDPLTRTMTEGEDIGFCMKMHAKGIKFFIDYSMVCHHFKQVSLLDVQNFIEHEKALIIDQCDKEIRRIVAKKQLERMNKPRIETPKTHLILPK
jgi:hypothetical protein